MTDGLGLDKLWALVSSRVDFARDLGRLEGSFDSRTDKVTDGFPGCIGREPSLHIDRMIENHRHSIVDSGGIQAGMGRDDARRKECLRTCRRVLDFGIGGPQACQGQGLIVSSVDPMGFFDRFGFWARERFPFVVAVGDEDATSVVDQWPIGRFFFDRLAAGIDHAVGNFWRIGPSRNEAPSHAFDFRFGLGGELPNDQDILGRSDVVSSLEKLGSLVG